MLHELPIHNVRLLACHEDWHRMTPTERGRHCRRCHREVVDFTQSTAAELAAARAAAADGRVCGRLRQSQLAGGRPVRFGLWARAFLAAAVLVLLQSLSACEARQQLPAKPSSSATAAEGRADTAASDTAAQAYWTDNLVTGFVAEPMPEFPGGQEQLVRYLQEHIPYPDSLRDAPQAQGRVFIGFTVTRQGYITAAEVVKGLHPVLDAAALRVVSQMPRWKPARQSGQATDTRYTLPITFSGAAD